LAAIHVCRTPPSDEHIGRPLDGPNMQHVVRRIANVDRNVEEDGESCCWVMERDVQTPFKPMYEVYLRPLLETSSQYLSQGHTYAPRLFMMRIRMTLFCLSRPKCGISRLQLDRLTPQSRDIYKVSERLQEVNVVLQSTLNT
jgi:hypothetical protein